MDELNLKAEQNIESVEDFQFEPIKGQPMLNWRGKRPFTSTQFYEAQQKESYGEEVNGWINKIYWGDNLQVMSHLLKKYRGKVDLIYIDPPFDSKADYKKKIQLRGKKTESDKTAFEEKQYMDIWSNDEYLQFMYERLILLRELLSDNGSIYVHMDEHRSHYIKVVLDEVFGSSCFRREIIWDITVLSGFKVSANNWIRGHDIILYYTKNPSSPFFNKLRQPHSQDYIDMFRWVDENGDHFLIAHGLKRYLKDVIKKGKPYGDVWDDLLSYQVLRKQLLDVRDLDKLKEVLSDTKAIQNISDVWDNVMSFQQQPTSAENCGYPTQKPESLLERIILASTNPGDLVFDCFMGSGTTQAVAMKLGRRFIGADINLGAIDTTVKRLEKVARELNETFQEEVKYTGFEVYNVNNYDVFRNPVQAKELLISALELQPLPGNELYDGEKDGRMVKIMPINRIATRVDLNELITGFPRETFDKRRTENPGKPVELVTLVCMGHESDLGANLQLQMKEEGYNIDVQVLDILRDRVDLEFRRDSEANIAIEGDRLVIRDFFPMNLLQKLSIEKTDVKEWRELVDSIKIDFNFDGAIFNPTIIDVPEDRELVKGSYKIPEDSGTIKVKITDLLSESCEVILNA
ncbi:MAG: site-specific DNA-methyltransferase [Bacteroidaceae bacterium]|nr:site-specific DNA-methyltransferase [Bacteroidaceae bacterium]